MFVLITDMIRGSAVSLFTPTLSMFQSGALIWLSACVLSTLPHNVLPLLHTRGIDFGGLFHLFDHHQPEETPQLSVPFKRPFFGPLFGNDKTSGDVGKPVWPQVQVKFDHPIQSPVDILTSRAVTMDLPVLHIVEPAQIGVKAKVYNSGHTVYVYIKEDPIYRPHLIGGPLKDKFVFEQMHFHWGTEDIWGSEHLIDGESFAVEIHMVHYNSRYQNFTCAAAQPDGLAVLTVFAGGNDDDNPLLDPLYKILPEIREANTSREIDSTPAMQWVRSALSLNHEYYTYPGSLTTPPYSENVVFILLPSIITLSHKQLAAFRDLHSDEHGQILENKRQVQPLHNRPIVRSTSLV